MEVEYFPPKEDIILQNAAPADLYILVVGAAVKILPYTYNSRPLTVGCFLYAYISNRNSSCEKVELNR